MSRFTELFDINAIPIYEGDIVKAPSGLLYKVEYDEDGDVLFNGEMSGTSTICGIDEHFEIVNYNIAG